MAAAMLHTDDFLEPVSPEQPAGANLRWTPDWDRIMEARRADDDLDPGKWAKKDRKSADWALVEELTSSLLRKRTKDLQLALWLVEAGIKRHGFVGLRDGLRLTRELMARYWDSGLYPPIEDGPEDRAGPLEWLNNKLVDSIDAIPITACSNGMPDYSLNGLRDARRTGSEASYLAKDGSVDAGKKKAFEAALASGHVSMDMFDRAVKATKRGTYEELAAVFHEAHDEFKALETVVDEKFGDAAPSLSLCRATLTEIGEEFTGILEKKRIQEPGVVPPTDERTQSAAGSPPAAASPAPTAVLPSFEMPASPPPGGSWQEAETLIRRGQVDKGLALMVHLSSCETSGRSRFQRKLLLAEICLASKRERLGRSILEELAEQIDKLQLEAWESTELICSVWTRLYKLFRQSEDGSDRERANKLYLRLSRLDPWQALSCGEE